MPLNNIVQINVLIITYNQKDVISRAIESVISQKAFGLKNIIICDDFSTDGNWNTIKSYTEKYPDIIKSYRNEKNLGIYQNFNKIVSLRETADFFYILSGDDKLNDGIFNKIQLCVREMCINPKDACSIYFDWISIDPNNKAKTHSNYLISKNSHPISLKHRGLISNRSVFISEGVISCFTPVDTDKGISLAEELFDRQYQIHSKKNYYYKFIGSIYYSKIGISLQLNNKTFYKENVITWKTINDIFKNDLVIKDYYYSIYKQFFFSYLFNPSIQKLIYIYIYYIKSFCRLNFYTLKKDIRVLFFLINRLIPKK